MQVTVVKLQLFKSFGSAYADEAAFGPALRDRLDPRGIPYQDLSAALVLRSSPSKDQRALLSTASLAIARALPGRSFMSWATSALSA